MAMSTALECCEPIVNSIVKALPQGVQPVRVSKVDQARNSKGRVAHE